MKKLVFLGDSITDCNHYFDSENLGYGYVRRISGKLNIPDKNYEIFNKGNDGFTVSALRRLWKRSCLNMQPDLITILIGINDLARIKNTGITAAAGLANFRDQYQLLLEDIRMITDCPILLMEPFIFPYPAEYAAWEEDLHAMNIIIQKLAGTNQLTFLPLWSVLSTAAKSIGFGAITTDGIHLTQEGHRILADLWLKTAEECI